MSVMDVVSRSALAQLKFSSRNFARIAAQGEFLPDTFGLVRPGEIARQLVLKQGNEPLGHDDQCFRLQ
ncbi:MAG TPA: hypothetical protein VMA30_22710 [Xanthobacteraceae bacterium]|nr:hypothetical protein [Xanthobacteraceae bacterium]